MATTYVGHQLINLAIVCEQTIDLGHKMIKCVHCRAISELLNICQERENVNYSLTASMVEIYNETVIDLFTSETPVSRSS